VATGGGGTAVRAADSTSDTVPIGAAMLGLLVAGAGVITMARARRGPFSRSAGKSLS
jgi:hypothetical protein